jgi:hypothetical protein
MGFPSADAFLGSLSRSQWLEWQEWVKVRGPVGGPRSDAYAWWMAVHAQPWGKDTDFTRMVMPWLRPGVDVAPYVTPWLDDDDDD